MWLASADCKRDFERAQPCERQLRRVREPLFVLKTPYDSGRNISRDAIHMHKKGRALLPGC
jgi:hypothetical protein